MNGVPPEVDLAALGFALVDSWDHATVVTDITTRWQALRRTDPKAVRGIRQTAWQLRQALHQDLPDIPPAIVEQVAICVLAKLAPLQVELGADPRAVGVANTVAAVAVLDDLWPANLRTQEAEPR